MGLLDFVGALFGNKNAAGQEKAVLTAVTDLVNQQPGGLTGLIEQFQQHGAAEIIESWAGNQANQSASAELLENVVGSSTVSDLAGKLGIAPEKASSLLAQVLPLVVQHATHGGQMPQSGQIDSTNVIASIQKAGGLATLAEGFLEKKES